MLNKKGNPFKSCNWSCLKICLFEEEKEFILCDNCIATCNTRSKLPMVIRFNLLTVLILKVMATSFLAQVPYLSVV